MVGYKELFEFLDQYARNHHCFLTEPFISSDEVRYTACFSPLGVRKDSPNRYACEYVNIPVEDARRMATGGVGTAEVRALLDSRLPAR
jgi:hypothetical protein